MTDTTPMPASTVFASTSEVITFGAARMHEFDSRADWLAAREHSLGGSDAPAVLGVDAYRGQFQVWLDKTEGVRMADFRDVTDPMKWGARLESAIRDGVMEDNEEYQLLFAASDTSLMIHPDRPFMHASLDGIVTTAGRGIGLMEIKNKSQYLAHEFNNNELPFDVIAQVQHNLAVTEYGWALVAVLVGGNDIRLFEVDRDENLVNQIIKIERDFWQQHVETRVMPQPDGLAATGKLLNEWFVPEPELAVQLPDAAWEAFIELRALKREIKENDLHKARLENIVKAFVGEATEAMHGEEVVATWRRHLTKRFDVTAFKEEHPELYNEYLQSDPTRRFVVKQPKSKK